MQIRTGVAVITALVLPCLAQARDLPGKESIAPEALASMQAIVDYCSSVDARSKAYFQRQEQIALLPVSEDGVEKSRASAIYRDDYRTDRAAYDRLPPGFGQAVCAAAVPAGARQGGNDQ